MSLVGPRPLVEGELEAHDGLKLYNQAKPGITGWWGCNGRSNIDYRERLELEYYYIKHGGGRSTDLYTNIFAMTGLLGVLSFFGFICSSMLKLITKKNRKGVLVCASPLMDYVRSSRNSFRWRSTMHFFFFVDVNVTASKLF